MQALSPVIALYKQGGNTTLLSFSWHTNLESRIIKVWNEAPKNCVQRRFSPASLTVVHLLLLWMCLVQRLWLGKEEMRSLEMIVIWNLGLWKSLALWRSWSCGPAWFLWPEGAMKVSRIFNYITSGPWRHLPGQGIWVQGTARGPRGWSGQPGVGRLQGWERLRMHFQGISCQKLLFFPGLLWKSLKPNYEFPNKHLIHIICYIICKNGGNIFSPEL